MTLPLTIGKTRHLQQCATPRGALAVLALDHRNNLRQLLNPDAPGEVSSDELVAFKGSLVHSLAPVSSAVLLDPEFSAAQCITLGKLPGATGLVIALEASGYAGESTARKSRVASNWSVEKAKRMGASAIKLLVYYHPDSTMAKDMELLVQEVARDTTTHDIPLFLEILTYSVDPVNKKLSPAERRRVVIEAARRLTPLGADILKVEFPLDVAAEPNERTWLEACTELSQASFIPWVLLSASVNYETFLRQVIAACTAGASGVAVGRAVWRETTDLAASERQAFLDGTARQRMQRVTALVEALARPWTDFYIPTPISPDWFVRY